MRLIDADGLLRQVEAKKGAYHPTIDILDLISDESTADAVPVVRCKDCARRGTPECGMYYECECGQQHTWETDNDYCSFGKRKEKTNE